MAPRRAEGACPLSALDGEPRKPRTRETPTLTPPETPASSAGEPSVERWHCPLAVAVKDTQVAKATNIVSTTAPKAAARPIRGLGRSARDVRARYLRTLGLPLPATSRERRLWCGDECVGAAGAAAARAPAFGAPAAACETLLLPHSREKLKDHGTSILNKLRRAISGVSIDEAAVLQEGGGDGGDSAAATRRVKFSERVDVVCIPKHSEYSERVRAALWASVHEIQGMAYRNMLEFELEGFSWEGVYEEHEMALCEESGTFVHPLYFAWQLQQFEDEENEEGAQQQQQRGFESEAAAAHVEWWDT